MKEDAKTIEELVRRLSPAEQEAVRDFVESMLRQRDSRPSGKPTFPWAGALKDLAGRFTSVELQHQISRWRMNAE